jgi:hypothetical protein
MNDKQTPPDWVLFEAAKRCGYRAEYADRARNEYDCATGSFRALCDMIERYEQPPVDRKLLCAREAAKECGYDWGDLSEYASEYACRRAIELWEGGFGV